MGLEYALVHLKYTVPPAILLTLAYRPLFTKLDVYKLVFLVLIAVASTTPWDSYLIRQRIWTYPTNAVFGPTLFQIPVEELFFFVIQTYNTSLLYLILSRPTFHPIYLQQETSLDHKSRLWMQKWLGNVVLLLAIVLGAFMLVKSEQGVYMGLIIVWVGPFLLMLWNLAYQFLLGLPHTNTVIPIALPTIYLWIVDTIALRRGTWVIESGTKLGWHLWEGLEIEEAVFFLLTNVLIVFGLVAFDNALAILEAFPFLFANVPSLPSPLLLVKALLVPSSEYDKDRIEGFRHALDRLRLKSRSFYLASGVFRGRLRADLILLYSFCRVADDLVDDAESIPEAKHWITKLNEFLDISYSVDGSEKTAIKGIYIRDTFPTFAQSALLLLPTDFLSLKPLRDLLKGFETDLHFSSLDTPFPITDEVKLEIYGSQVAGTVAELCLELVYHHTRTSVAHHVSRSVIQAASRMGIALQYVNISRDISVDAATGRVYLPTTWLNSKGLQPEDVVRDPSSAEVELLRQCLLTLAMQIYNQCKSAIEQLPLEARGPMRVAVESYVEIGRVMQSPSYRLKAGRATVPKLRRLQVAWNALNH